MRLRVLYQDESLVAIEKPAGFHVHPPEDRRHTISDSVNCLHILRRQLDRYLYPVHRLDGATSGVVLFALDSEAAAGIQLQFRERQVSKVYFAVARGWIAPEGVIDSPLGDAPSRTVFARVGAIELPVAIGPHASSRYSLVQVQPETGRMHQIRRHFAHIRHPLIGDTIYGDGKHNRLFWEKIPGSGLFLKAYALRLKHPRTARDLTIVANWNHSWHQVFELFGICAAYPAFSISASRT